MWKEFKKFIMRGNVIDLAIAVVLGAAFGAVVKSLVDDVITPIIGKLISGIDFSHFKIVLTAAGADGKGEVAIRYGVLLQTIIAFIIISFVIFLIVKAINALRERQKKDEPEEEVKKSDEVLILEEIRDEIRKR